jgi:hypothetical protein
MERSLFAGGGEMSQGVKKYAIAGTSQKPRRSEVTTICRSELPPIAADTVLVSTEKASELLRDERGWNLSKVLIQRRCASGQWQRGFHWTKVGKQYLIHMEAVYKSIVDGTA